MISVVTQFGESSSGLGALGVDGQAFIIQLITFILAFLVLRKWAFKPILKVLQERREAIDKGVRLGEQMQKRQVELEKEVDKTLHEARTKADGIIAASQDTARRSAQQIEEKARAKASSIVEEAKTSIAQDTKRARKQLEGELAELISEATEAIIDEKVDTKKDASLIDRVLKESAKV